MAGGAGGGTGGGIESASLLWAVIMSAFAGTSVAGSPASSELTVLFFRLWWNLVRVRIVSYRFSTQAQRSGVQL